ncbi:cytochrome d ubiquinol oxidase subunit II [Niallia taxi]|uniref:Cytochrome d ubiquinol oxidase subunit II n=1 Tax=Niallia taxi TaxID=2499688 RepID=A0A3S2TV12_9BACI|nr:cytochrome d ubiquinol oxidase subunit II [Niallia taxi]MCM3214997.1 cytochrome d ubiquinol oxidase subunit II [Niallia taxi]MDK8639296.1 cytochrome d ubiquinol oxidase subunit II [Niallia taxi]MED4036540.1 cytochrome d ubiquinol oxidase subunit II [Niallia taxi]MED4053024.1 cytochrome d ubiquinol oxidase subunit II [Niallia taxi]MED4118164.1 cytochrome d ubiquinol oxidase subunit II [Niallia taxi]
MTDSLLAITVLWGFVFIYAIMATMDFGAGFWSMIYINRDKTRATNIANRYLSPTWEVTNTFVVAIVVAVYSLFPKAAYTLGTVLLIPGSLILLLLAIRSAFLVFSNIVEEYRKPLTYISGITGMLIPGILLSVLPVTHGGFVDFADGKQSLDLVGLFSSPNEYAFFGFALSSTLFLSSLLLADYSNVSKEPEAYRLYRRDAIILGPISLLMAVFIMITLKQDANWIYVKMMDDLYLLLLSLFFFLLGGAGLFLPSRKNKDIKGVPRLAIVSITIQYLIASYVYGKAHLPYIVYPEVTITSSFTSPSSFHAIFATYIAAFIILFPGFYFFWKLFMHDKKYLQATKK